MHCNTAGFRWWGRSGAGVGASSRARRGNRRRLRPALLSLEERRLLATFTVTSTADSGAGSLRAAIEQANAANGVNTINFSSLFDTPQTIGLRSGQLALSDSGLTITGPASGVTLNAGGADSGPPGQRECHGVPLGADALGGRSHRGPGWRTAQSHRRERDVDQLQDFRQRRGSLSRRPLLRQRRRCRKLRNDDSHQLHNQRQLSRERWRRHVQRWYGDADQHHREKQCGRRQRWRPA